MGRNYYAEPNYPLLTLDAGSGKYEYDRNPVMGVHETIFFAGCADEAWFEAANERPNAMEVIRSAKYALAFDAFCKLAKFNLIECLSGKQAYNSFWEYAMLTGIVGEINRAHWAIEIRTEPAVTVDRLVTAAFSGIPDVALWGPKRSVLQLNEDGSYVSTIHTDNEEKEVFLSVLQTAQWCKQRGIRRREADRAPTPTLIGGPADPMLLSRA